MGIDERKLREKEVLRQKILEAAAEIVDAEGVLGFSMRKLAKKINYSATTIYLFLKDKETLLRSLADVGARRFASLVESSEAWSSEPPIERLRILMRRFFEVCLENPKAYLSSFFGELPTSAPSLLGFSEDSLSNPSFALFLDIIAAGNADGSMRVSDPKTAVQVCWAASHGLILAIIASPKVERRRRQELVETSIAMLIAGLIAEVR
jgi:AcrR family transcriptional regulator